MKNFGGYIIVFGVYCFCWAGFWLQEYINHEQFGEEFTKLLDSIVEEFGPLPAEDAAAGKDGKDTKDGKDASEGKDGKESKEGKDEKVPRKRRNSASNEIAKRQKVESGKVKTIESVGAQGALVETPLLNAKIEGVTLHIKSGNRPYIFNNSSQEAGLKSGLIVCGFGKGTWKLRDGPEDVGNPQKEILFNLEGPDDLVPWFQ